MIVLESDITEDTEIKAKRPGGGGGWWVWFDTLTLFRKKNS